jgi:hypothetical protein
MSAFICDQMVENKFVTSVYQLLMNFNIYRNIFFSRSSSPLYFCSDVAWIGSVQGANDVHPIMECSNRGLCNRNTGLCTCYDNFEG